MLFPEPPSNRTLERFPEYLRSRPFFWVTHSGSPHRSHSSILSDSEVGMICGAFAEKNSFALIAARHGRPMLYHGIIKREPKGAFRLVEALLEEPRDLESLISAFLEFSHIFWEFRVHELIVPIPEIFSAQTKRDLEKVKSDLFLIRT